MRVSVKHNPTLAFLIFIHLSLYVILHPDAHAAAYPREKG